MSHPARGAWIEIVTITGNDGDTTSHPARGAWIEITEEQYMRSLDDVAPRKGCVD